MADTESKSDLASGGGNATASGAAFQAQVAAYFGSALLAEQSLDRPAGLGHAVPVSIRCETEAPVDDLLIETNNGGFIFIQAKSSVNLTKNPSSPLGKSADQFVRQWLLCAVGIGQRTWDRPLSLSKDRLVLAIGPASANSVKNDLADALRSLRFGTDSTRPKDQESALQTFLTMLADAWKTATGAESDPAEVRRLASFIDVVVFDLAGPDQLAITSMMRRTLQNEDDADASVAVLSDRFLRLMSRRSGVDSRGLRNLLAGACRLKEPPSYRQDVEKLRQYSDQTRAHLQHLEETKINGLTITIGRQCTDAVIAAGQKESILIVGDPGAGKSAAISSAAQKLRSQGAEVIELAVDRLPIESADELQRQLGLEHRVLDVLDNWPGNDPAFLFIDALDASRGGQGQRVFRWLISEVLRLQRPRWRIIASMRSFDLRMGQELADLFAGEPPHDEYAHRDFKNVKHVLIPAWTDDELDQLLAQAEPLAKAIAVGGAKLRQLARAPFNTRLLADLLSRGADPEAFGQVSTQSQLLDLYWRYRVIPHGEGVLICLQDTITAMVSKRSLQTQRIAISKNNAIALQAMLAEDVLMLVAGGRYISFRHHILFDYAASKVFLNLYDQASLAETMNSARAPGLLLGPALIFALDEIWQDTPPERSAFWSALLTCVGRGEVDAVVRSIAARVASELPATGGDVAGLLRPLAVPAEREAGKVTITHVVGSLTVRADDGVDIAVEPWSVLAEGLASYLPLMAWPLRIVLFLLAERSQTDVQRARLGVAARALLAYGLEHDPKLAQSAIGFVADTYGSDVDASRTLLQSIFTPARFKAHGEEYVPWLTEKLGKIYPFDTGFVLDIYDKTFADIISDQSPNDIGQSRILRLRGTRRQSYEMAYWRLQEFFPKLLRADPLIATRAYVKAVKGFILREHPPRENLEKTTVRIADRTCSLQEDWSYIWASNPNDPHGDNALQISKTFTDWLRTAEPDVARQATATLIDENEMGFVWARLFMVAAERPEVLGPSLWPIATTFPFLWASDTRKDAIDLIAVMYPAIPEQDRLIFERTALAFDFSSHEKPAKAREYVLTTLFATIGVAQLITLEARDIGAPKKEEQGRQYKNERPVRFDSGWGGETEYGWWLREEGVDIAAPANARILALAKALKEDIKPENRTGAFPDTRTAIGRLTTYLSEIDGETDSDPRTKEHAEDVAAELLEALIDMFEKDLIDKPSEIATLCDMVTRFAAHASPVLEEQTESNFENSPSWASAPRISAAHASLVLGRLSIEAVHRLRPVIDQLLVDRHPAVRMAIATHINAIWLVDRNYMWALAERVAISEINCAVLSLFTNGVLGRLVHSAPDKVEQLLSIIAVRCTTEERFHQVREPVGNLICILWVTHARPAARAILESWLASIVERYDEINSAVQMLRGAVIAGYEDGNPEQVELRKRALELADRVTEISAEILLVLVSSTPLNEAEQVRATAAARLSDHVLNQLYFSSGAFRHGGGREDGERPLHTNAGKRAFLHDVTPIIRRITQASGPETIHYLVDLLDFLMDADPEHVFSLTAAALLGAGRDQGYHFEHLAADQVVKVIGRFLADYRSLFDDEDRRQNLVRCLDMFIEVGWPSARRLLYRLPELLQ